MVVDGGNGPAEEPLKNEGAPAAIPWRRVAALLRPIRWGLAAMVGLSVGGVLVGLVPPLALGVLVNALVDRGDTREAALLAALIMVAMVVEGLAYIASDGLYARNAGRMYRDLRMMMFAGASRRPRGGQDETSGLASRFISDAETVERITVSLLDTGSMMLVEFVSALVALALLGPWGVVIVVPLLAGMWVVTRRTQVPAARAAQERQEELERMTQSLVQELDRRADPQSAGRFRAATDRLLAAEVRLGWLRAANLQGSGAFAKLGPIAVVVGAAFAGCHHAGTLLAIYLLAQRAFWGFDGLVDLSLGMQTVRGAVARCFALIDTEADSRRLDAAA